jgi:DNA-binding transcriptional regulator YhcF (GntR family)
MSGLDLNCEAETVCDSSNGPAKRHKNRRQEAARSDAETGIERLLQRTDQLGVRKEKVLRIASHLLDNLF